jgi:alkylated DNA repair protein (DNA oxidative demethylase)
MFEGHVLLKPQYLSTEVRAQVLEEILSFKPIWEYRYSTHRPPPRGEGNRMLLRPVYWLGNWQFACLNYYHPPKGIENRCVLGEDYPPTLKKIVADIEKRARSNWDERDLPQSWHLNTCLINYYGSKIEKDENGSIRKLDAARVGEHKDFEPGPVASLSFGERAVFQFVKSQGFKSSSEVVLQQKLDDNTLQVFGGDRYKNQLFHRVQRVTKAQGPGLPPTPIEGFETRRINLTFRYVPPVHIKPLHRFPQDLMSDILGYVQMLSKTSGYWKRELETLARKSP